jgi:tRNA1Val (adenine37-N6)-methyltransferase
MGSPLGLPFSFATFTPMGNAWFQFKQFRIEQDRSALKVGTDACILGAWAGSENPQTMLDIGTGTGLLALMLAQRYRGSIVALEPDEESAGQAQQNFENSPWPARLQLVREKVQQFSASSPFDLIVCNPPFYPHHLKAANARRNEALHQDTLSFPELAQACARLLAPAGLCYILLPPRQALEFEQEARRQGLYAQKKLFVQERADSPMHRTVYGYGFANTAAVAEEQLCIREEGGAYSQAYRNLLQGYYLIF